MRQALLRRSCSFRHKAPIRLASSPWVTCVRRDMCRVVVRGKYRLDMAPHAYSSASHGQARWLLRCTARSARNSRRTALLTCCGSRMPMPGLTLGPQHCDAHAHDMADDGASKTGRRTSSRGAWGARGWSRSRSLRCDGAVAVLRTKERSIAQRGQLQQHKIKTAVWLWLLFAARQPHSPPGALCAQQAVSCLARRTGAHRFPFTTVRTCGVSWRSCSP